MASTSHGTREVEGAENADKLSHAEVKDEADSASRAPADDLKGKRVRAIPGNGGTTVVVRAVDFKNNGIDHPKVTWDFRKDQFTVPVGKNKPLSAEAADFLVKEFPMQFEYFGE